MRSLIAAGPTTGPGCGYPGTVDRMGKALIIVLGIALLVYAFFDLIATPGDRVRFMPKPLWFIVLLLAPVGPLIWIFFGRLNLRSAQAEWRCRLDSPPGPRGPDDDPDYLRGL